MIANARSTAQEVAVHLGRFTKGVLFLPVLTSSLAHHMAVAHVCLRRSNALDGQVGPKHSSSTAEGGRELSLTGAYAETAVLHQR